MEIMPLDLRDVGREPIHIWFMSKMKLLIHKIFQVRQILTKKIFEKPISVGKLKKQVFLWMEFHIHVFVSCLSLRLIVNVRMSVLQFFCIFVNLLKTF